MKNIWLIISRILRLSVTGIILFASFSAIAEASVWVATTGVWAIDTGGWRLDLYGKCRNIANTCGTLMIPGGSDAEWTSFLTSPPGCITISECCSAWSNLWPGDSGDEAYNSADGGWYQCSCY